MLLQPQNDVQNNVLTEYVKISMWAAFGSINSENPGI